MHLPLPFPSRRVLRSITLLVVPALMSGCSAVVLAPAGDVAAQQGNLVMLATALLLLIIVPVMVLIALFAWRYRHSNSKATYTPEWHHSTALELVIWSAPLLIIICLGAVTWTSTHLLDPYRPIGRIDANRAISAEAKPLRVQVVALDWKWLFIYPDYGIATVNELAAPLDRPIAFELTASSVMNSFYVPNLAGQIYAMPGMTTKLNAIVNRPGNFTGFSSNFSGEGFSGMHFRFHAVPAQDFDSWVRRIRTGGSTLDRARYLKLAKPSADTPVMRFAGVAPGLFDAAANRCVAPGETCMRDMMMADAGGKHVMAMSAMPRSKPAGPIETSTTTAKNSADDTARLTGAGLSMPGAQRTN
ncbi:ubiquinol oxidase subunit II [Sphingomonas sp.]|uniref:ubiquinol oxidase subunit II n=1 Tax=Sphingomonas sp. TaxID=28214 RepID=UPI0033418E07